MSFIVSGNRGATWSKPRRIDDQLPMSLFRADSTIDPEPFPCPDPAKTGRCPIRSGDFIPEVAVNGSNGNLYAVWMDARFSFFATGAFQYDSIAYSQSTNGGATWSSPIQVNLTPNSEPINDRQAFTPSVDVGADGTVTVSYYDFRENTPDPATLLPATTRPTATRHRRTAPTRRAGTRKRRSDRRSTSARRRSPAATSSATTWAWRTPGTSSCRPSGQRSAAARRASSSAG